MHVTNDLKEIHCTVVLVSAAARALAPMETKISSMWLDNALMTGEYRGQERQRAGRDREQDLDIN